MPAGGARQGIRSFRATPNRPRVVSSRGVRSLDGAYSTQSTARAEAGGARGRLVVVVALNRPRTPSPMALWSIRGTARSWEEAVPRDDEQASSATGVALGAEGSHRLRHSVHAHRRLARRLTSPGSRTAKGPSRSWPARRDRNDLGRGLLGPPRASGSRSARCCPRRSLPASQQEPRSPSVYP